mgnify:CR=1 FL=1
MGMMTLRETIGVILFRTSTTLGTMKRIAVYCGSNKGTRPEYAKAAESLLKPSSAARAVSNGAPFIERVDLLVKLISHQLGMPNAEIDRTVQIVDQKLKQHQSSITAQQQRKYSDKD